MKFVKRDIVEIDDDDIVRIKKIKDKIEMTKFDKISYDISQFRNIENGKTARILKNGRLSKGKKQKDNSIKKDGIKYRTVSSVRKSLKQLSDLIEANFGDGDNEFLVTLSFDADKKINRITQAELCAEKLFKKLNKQMKDFKIVYICKYEPNMFGGWHLHLIIRFESKNNIKISIDGLQKELEQVWGFGDVYIDKLWSNLDDLQSYLCDIKKPDKDYYKYKKMLTNRKTEEDKKYNKMKKYEQAKRYPHGSRVYSTSNRLIRADKSDATQKEYEQMVQNKKCTSAYSAYIVDDGGEIVNGITKTVHK